MVTDAQMIAATKAYAGIDGKCRPAAMRAALEAALSASDAEPVAWVDDQELRYLEMVTGNKVWGDSQRSVRVGGRKEGRSPLYAAPPAVSVKALEWNGMECRSSRGDLYSIHRLSENVWVARKNGTSISDWHGTEDAAKAAAQADYETRAALVSPADTSPERYRHKKRGTVYEVIARGHLQVDGDLDNEKVVIYRDNDGQTWARPEYEFNDGRFEILVAAPKESDRG